VSQTQLSPKSRRRIPLATFGRFAVACLIALGAVTFSSAVMVPAGQAVVVTCFGAPVRVLTDPGLAWKWPAPVEATIPIDLRLHTSSGGLSDVGTREGLRILVQAYVIWSVPDDPARIRRYLRAGGNDPDEVARQLRSLLGSALQVTASDFALSDLVDTDPSRVRLGAFEEALANAIRGQALDTYGIRIGQVGVERLSLPAETLAATVARMRAERETVAAERTAEGLRRAASIRSDAGRDARILAARTHAEAAGIEADAQEKAASTYAAAYARDPQLYAVLRSLDTLTAVVGPRTRLVLRTDSAPFSVLVDGPAAPVAKP
jgi:membrane protease subunit HflC